MVITRNIMHPDIEYFDPLTHISYRYDDICERINQWRNVLHNDYHAQPGQLLAISVFEVNVNHIAIIFAAAELGLELFVIDWPLRWETLHKTKMGIFGPVDFAIEDVEHRETFPLHHAMIEKYSSVLIPDTAYQTASKDFVTYLGPHPKMPFLFSSTSGTTSKSKPVHFSHEHAYRLSLRNIPIFKFTETSRVVHVKNMHHASSAFTDLLPSLMASRFHTYQPHPIKELSPNTLHPKWTMREFIEMLETQRITHMAVKNIYDLEDYLAERPTFTQTILVNMSGFTVPEYFLDLCRRHNLEFISHYGSIDTGIPLLVNHVTPETIFIPHSLGVIPDDFYQFVVTPEGKTLIESSLWQGPIELQDRLVCLSSGEYIHHGRWNDDSKMDILSGDFTIVHADNGKHLAVWDTTTSDEDLRFTIIGDKYLGGTLYQFASVRRLNKRDFITDTKVNMDQLRAYFETVEPLSHNIRWGLREGK